MVCDGASIPRCNLTLLIEDYGRKLDWTVSEPYVCVSKHYGFIYFIFSIVPYIILLFAIASPLHKGFEYYYNDMPKLLTWSNNEDESLTKVRRFYDEIKWELARADISPIIIKVTKGREDIRNFEGD